MQGVKIYQEKLFSSFQLSDRFPKDTFYRRLKAVLHLDFLYSDTQMYYGDSGQKSIDPVVFFKLCLVGYLENIISDRKLISHCSMRLDILYFIGYDIDDALPWHSTISRTGQLFPEAVFENVFIHVLEMCIGKGMVKGSTQAIDSAPVKANASMDSLELKVPAKDLEAHLFGLRHISRRDKEVFRKAKENKASQEQQSITATDKELTLTQFMGMRKINTIGIKQANKVMHLSAMAYNLKKYLKYTTRKVKSGMGTYSLHFCSQTILQNAIKLDLGYSNLRLYQLR